MKKNKHDEKPEKKGQDTNLDRKARKKLDILAEPGRIRKSRGGGRGGEGAVLLSGNSACKGPNLGIAFAMFAKLNGSVI